MNIKPVENMRYRMYMAYRDNYKVYAVLDTSKQNISSSGSWLLYDTDKWKNASNPLSVAEAFYYSENSIVVAQADNINHLVPKS